MTRLKIYIWGQLDRVDDELRECYWFQFGRIQRLRKYRQACMDILREMEVIADDEGFF
jgi:hypothetical protein